MTGPDPGRLRMRPRRFGLGILVVTAAILVAAINYGNNLIFLLAFIMLALMINSAWQGRRALASVQIRALPPPMRPANTHGELTVSLVSRPGLPALRLGLGDTSDAVITNLAPGERKTVELGLPPAPRGFLRVPGITLRTDYPLGLWQMEYRHQPRIGQWLHPAAIEGPLRDDHQSTVENHGDDDVSDGDPTQLRDYQPGDPLRRIAFHHYAKTRRLVSRQVEGESRPAEPMLIDYHHYLGSQEDRLSAMTRDLRALSQADKPWTLRLPRQLPVSAQGAAGRTPLRQALERLARFGHVPDADGFDLAPPADETST